MRKSLIKLAYRQIIDATATGRFEKDVFNDSYSEFLIQIQTYNQVNNYTTWREVRTAIPKSNVTLQYKVGFAIGLYVRELNNQIPGLWDNLERMNVPFADYRFELLESDITNRSAHRVALTYLTDSLTLLGTIGEYMVLALGDKSKETAPLETFMVAMRPNLAVLSYQEI
jgi:hypothetical protein